MDVQEILGERRGVVESPPGRGKGGCAAATGGIAWRRGWGGERCAGWADGRLNKSSSLGVYGMHVVNVLCVRVSVDGRFCVCKIMLAMRMYESFVCVHTRNFFLKKHKIARDW